MYLCGMIVGNDIPAKGKIISPFDGFQTDFTSSNADIVFGAGGVGNGKSISLVLTIAEPLMLDGEFRALITRRSLQNQKAGGGLVDAFKTVFGDYCDIKQSDSPRVTFPSGSYCDLTYLDDTKLDKMRERSKGWQFDVIEIDELTEMPWNVFTYILTRNRGRSQVMTGKFRAAYNPKRSHWTRTFVDWYIGSDGTVIAERNGRVRYFYIYGDTEDDVAWGNTKEEVYEKCRIDIDRKLEKLGDRFTYKNFIKSFVLYVGNVSENRALIGNNADYVGSVAAAGGKMSQQLLEVNFNVDPDEDDDAPMPSNKVRECFLNDAKRTGIKWITVDLASEGNDNLVALLWDGFHCYNKLVRSNTTPQGNANLVRQFAAENDVPTNHIIFDAVNGSYFKDYIPDAIAFKSTYKPIGLYKDTACTMKDLVYLRLCQMVRDGNITFDERLAQSLYIHKGLSPITMQNEIMEEFSVIRFDELQNGKKRLWAKKKMNKMLGKGRSMDVSDPCAMLMYPYVNAEYGSEFDEKYVRGFSKKTVHQETTRFEYQPSTIYDDTLWA